MEIYLNGKPYSTGFATEHLSRRQWGQRYGDADYFFVKSRSKNSQKDLVGYRRKLGTLLSPLYLAELLSAYRNMLRNFGAPHDHYFDLLTTFLKKRPAFVRRELQDLLSLNDPVVCKIIVPEGSELSVDGFSYRGSYQGTYFATTPLTFELAEPPADSDWYWLVNNRKVSGQRVELLLQHDTDIALVALPRRSGGNEPAVRKPASLPGQGPALQGRR